LWGGPRAKPSTRSADGGPEENAVLGRQPRSAPPRLNKKRCGAGAIKARQREDKPRSQPARIFSCAKSRTAGQTQPTADNKTMRSRRDPRPREDKPRSQPARIFASLKRLGGDSLAPPICLFDASTRLSLAGCVPAVPASVSPRAERVPQAAGKLNSAATRHLRALIAAPDADVLGSVNHCSLLPSSGSLPIHRPHCTLSAAKPVVCIGSFLVFRMKGLTHE
jgi:hypothetical protein